MQSLTRSPRWLVVLAVGSATAVGAVALEPLVVTFSDQLLAPFFLVVVAGFIGAVLVALEPTGVRQSVGIGLLMGSVVAFLVLVVLIVLELSALGTTGV